MADSHQRELERAASSGDVEAKAKLLLERVRSGELTEERLRLAASLGNQGATLALAGAAVEIHDLTDSRVWQQLLEKWGGHLSVRVAVALVRESLDRRPEPRHKDVATAALLAATRWLACPCSDHAIHAETAWKRLPPYERGEDPLTFFAAVAARGALLAQQGSLVLQPVYMTTCLRPGDDGAFPAAASLRLARVALTHWALGTSDRIEARQREAPSD